MIQKIDHLVITSRDVEKTIAFYEALGFQSKYASGRCELFSGDFKINVHYAGQELLPKAGTVQPGSADLCFEIDIPMDECVRCLAEAQLEIELGPVMRNGTRGQMDSVYLRDPDENLIELCSYS